VNTSLINSFFAELKRRNVFKVGVAYLVLAWLLIQITVTAVPALSMPEWVDTVVFFFCILGFPFALFFAWAFEITPEGIKKESDIPSANSIAFDTGRKLNFVIIGLLLLIAGYFIYESRFSSEDELNLIRQGPLPEIDSMVTNPEGSSIAVLPFVNMSSDKEQEYFSDGISEEILNVLAQLPQLKVTSRSSAFAFKGKEISIREVATKLGVSNILEGSVRKSGNRIRITAQLIEATSDTHLWSETYDRELTDIFIIQDEISTAIVKALKSKLGLDNILAARDMSRVNLDAHNEYLKGRFYIEKRTLIDLEKALGNFEKSIEIDQDYAPAWMGKALASLFLSESQYGNVMPEVAIINARFAAQKALVLDSTLAESYAVMGLIEHHSNELFKGFYGAWMPEIALANARLAAEQAFALDATLAESDAIMGLIGLSDSHNEKANLNYQKAITLNPNYADAYNWYAHSDVERSLELSEKAVRLNPMSIIINSTYGHLLSKTRQFDKATKIALYMLDIDPSSHAAYNLLRSISYDEGNRGKSLFYHAKTVSLNLTAINIHLLSESYQAIGLTNEAIELWRSTSYYEALKAYIRKDFKEHNRFLRLIFPRSENDKFGANGRAASELFAGNFEETIKYLKMAGKLEHPFGIYAYQQLGDDDAAAAIIVKWKKQYKALYNAGSENIHGLATLIAFAENDIDKMVLLIKHRLVSQDNYVIEHRYIHIPMYQTLREHPQWESILAKSDNKTLKFRQDYLQFAGRDAELVAREQRSN
jgi:TolB-like protein/Tfp pilus assembly protein PilF